MNKFFHKIKEVVIRFFDKITLKSRKKDLMQKGGVDKTSEPPKRTESLDTTNPKTISTNGQPLNKAIQNKENETKPSGQIVENDNDQTGSSVIIKTVSEDSEKKEDTPQFVKRIKLGQRINQEVLERKTTIAEDRPHIEPITGPIDENKLKLIRKVNYQSNRMFNQDTLEYFPIVLMPSFGTSIKPPVNGKNHNRGVTEASFCEDYLIRYFNKNIYDYLTVYVNGSPFEPDLALIDLDSGKNIFIDIEIDEPYDGLTRQPTHYKIPNGTIDDQRNKGFIERGWIVVRFAEEQIMSNPHGCCQYLYTIMKTIYPGFPVISFYGVNPLDKVKIWTESEARILAMNNKREQYLGISQFRKSANSLKKSIYDSILGQEIEASLISPNFSQYVNKDDNNTKTYSNPPRSPQEEKDLQTQYKPREDVKVAVTPPRSYGL